MTNKRLQLNTTNAAFFQLLISPSLWLPTYLSRTLRLQTAVPDLGSAEPETIDTWPRNNWVRWIIEGDWGYQETCDQASCPSSSHRTRPNI